MVDCWDMQDGDCCAIEQLGVPLPLLELLFLDKKEPSRFVNNGNECEGSFKNPEEGPAYVDTPTFAFGFLYVPPGVFNSGLSL